MGKKTDQNKDLLAEVDKTFADLFKGIGNNRQQLFNKVLNVHKALHKELTGEKVEAVREKAIRQEVSRTVKMAAQQLPQRGNAPQQVVPPKKK